MNTSRTYPSTALAFKDASYACALERPMPLMRRLFGWLWRD
jgi:hypothetical protein